MPRPKSQCQEKIKKEREAVQLSPPPSSDILVGKLFVRRYGCARVGEPRYTYVNVSLAFLRILPISECFFLYRMAQQGDFFPLLHSPAPTDKISYCCPNVTGDKPWRNVASRDPIKALRRSNLHADLDGIDADESSLDPPWRMRCDDVCVPLSLSLSRGERYVCSLSSYYCKVELFYTFFRWTTPSNNSFPSPMMAAFFAIRHDIPD